MELKSMLAILYGCLASLAEPQNEADLKHALSSIDEFQNVDLVFAMTRTAPKELRVGMSQAVAHVIAINVVESGADKRFSIDELAARLRELYYDLLVEPCAKVRDFYEKHANCLQRVKASKDPTEFRWSKLGRMEEFCGLIMSEFYHPLSLKRRFVEEMQKLHTDNQRCGHCLRSNALARSADPL